MCGNCGSSPPWAPENLKRATPAFRLALEKRMAERQAIFKQEFQQRLTQLRKQGFLVETYKHEDATATDPNSESVNQRDTRVSHPTVSQPVSETEIEIREKAEMDHADTVHCTAEPALEMTEVAVEGVAEHQLDIPNAPEPVSHLADGVEEVHVRDSEAAGDGEGPRRSARSDYDSDAESFHTADEEGSVLRDGDHVPPVVKSQQGRSGGNGENVAGDEKKFGDWTEGLYGQVRKGGHGEPELEEVSFEEDRDHFDPVTNGDILDQAMLQQVQLDAVEIPLRREKEADVNGASLSEESSASKPTNDSSESLDIPTLPMQAIEAGQSVTSMPSENLEDAVYARRRPTRGHSRQNSLHLDHYPLPPDLVPLQTTEIELEKANVPQLSCSDCTAWRTRVEQLQAQVEGLTATLALRDRECASLKAKYVGKGRELGKNEARLMQECESLRVTTEFLYKKLERYERH